MYSHTRTITYIHISVPPKAERYDRRRAHEHFRMRSCIYIHTQYHIYTYICIYICTSKSEEGRRAASARTPSYAIIHIYIHAHNNIYTYIYIYIYIYVPPKVGRDDGPRVHEHFPGPDGQSGCARYTPAH